MSPRWIRRFWSTASSPVRVRNRRRWSGVQPLGEVTDPFYEVQAIVEAGDNGRSQVTLYCNQQEFSGLEYGNDLFAAVTRIDAAADGERYPCYITDIDLSGLHGNGAARPSSTCATNRVLRPR